MQTLGRCCSCGSNLHYCLNCGQSSIPDLLSMIKGPWAIIYWQVTPSGKFLSVIYSVASFPPSMLLDKGTFFIFCRIVQEAFGLVEMHLVGEASLFTGLQRMTQDFCFLPCLLLCQVIRLPVYTALYNTSFLAVTVQIL